MKDLTCTKNVLTFVNIVLFFFGFLMLGLAIWLLIDPMYYEPARFIEINNFVIVSYLNLVFSSLMIILAILGSLALRNENEKLIAVYFLGMMILAILSILSIVLTTSYGFNEKLEDFITRQINLNMQKLYESERSNSFINFIQMKFRCCGAIDSSDYIRYGMNYPVSCTNEHYGNPNFLYLQGCGYNLTNFFENRAAIILGLFCFISVFVILAIVFSIIFYRSITHVINDE